MLLEDPYIAIRIPEDEYVYADSLSKFRPLLNLLCLAFYLLMVFMSFFMVFIAAPYEMIYKPRWMFVSLSILSVYLMISVLYNYYKSCTIKPFKIRDTARSPKCSLCHTYKPPNAHHCQVCNTCIIDMDHHCAWIQQCVGVHNHRHFFQFLVFLTCGATLVFFGAKNTLYYGLYIGGENAYCDNIQLSSVPWRDPLCSFGNFPIYLCIACAYYLSIITMISVGALTYWNFAMISFKMTFIRVLKGQGPPARNIALFPFFAPHFKQNWSRFLGLRGDLSFFRRILLPSDHKSYNQMKAEENCG